MAGELSGSRAVVLNGSPQREGNSVAMARRFLAGLALGGGVVEAEWVHLYDLALLPCRGCMACRGGGVCRLEGEDDFAGVRSGLARSRWVVLASPLHFTSLSAPVVAFISRLQAFWPGFAGGAKLPALERRGVLLLSGGGEYGRMFEPARAVAAAAFKTLGVEFSGMVTASGTDVRGVGEQPAVLAELDALAARLRA